MAIFPEWKESKKQDGELSKMVKRAKSMMVNSPNRKRAKSKMATLQMIKRAKNKMAIIPM